MKPVFSRTRSSARRRCHVTSRGNYGSTLHDTPEQNLLIVVCDLCLKAASDAGQVLMIDPTPPRRPVMSVWTAPGWEPPEAS